MLNLKSNYKMMRDIKNVITVPTSIEGKFFRYWFEFLRPFHKLTDREIDVISAFAKERFELSKVIKDPDILDKVTMSEDTKRKVRTDCNMTQAHFQVIMTKLKKSRVPDNPKINPKFLPKFSVEDKSVCLLLSFEL